MFRNSKMSNRRHVLHFVINHQSMLDLCTGRLNLWRPCGNDSCKTNAFGSLIQQGPGFTCRLNVTYNEQKNGGGGFINKIDPKVLDLLHPLVNIMLCGLIYKPLSFLKQKKKCFFLFFSCYLDFWLFFLSLALYTHSLRTDTIFLFLLISLPEYCLYWITFTFSQSSYLFLFIFLILPLISMQLHLYGVFNHRLRHEAAWQKKNTVLDLVIKLLRWHKENLMRNQTILDAVDLNLRAAAVIVNTVLCSSINSH